MKSSAELEALIDRAIAEGPSSPVLFEAQQASAELNRRLLALHPA